MESDNMLRAGWFCALPEGIHIHRTEGQRPVLLPAGHWVNFNLSHPGEQEKSNTHFSIDIIPLTGKA
jgi:hypothetical protein